MPKFIYVARDVNGVKVSGFEDGVGKEDVIERLQKRNLLVINIMTDTDRDIGTILPQVNAGPKYKVRRHAGVNAGDLVLLCRQLTTLLGAGVTILRSLDTIGKQVASEKLYKVIRDLMKLMEGGLSFHEALEKHKDVFSDVWVNLVESGEASGNLAVVLDRLATYLERNEEFKKKVVSAMIYPCILLVGSIGALFFLTIKIVPTFAEVFKGFNIDLPAPTKVLMSISYFMQKFWWVLILGTAGGVFALKMYIKTPVGKKNWEKFLFALPVFGEFVRALSVERFSSEMSTLVESGVPILYSLEITQQSSGSVILGEIIKNIKEDVKAGKPLSQPLEKSGFFEPMVVQMVAVGEEIGELSQMFKRINVFYQAYVETFLTRIMTLFEPMVLLFMGGMIGAMVIGMFLPLFKLSQAAG